MFHNNTTGTENVQEKKSKKNGDSHFKMVKKAKKVLKMFRYRK